MQDVEKTQHYTSQADLICEGLLKTLPVRENDRILEPYAGELDLQQYVKQHFSKAHWELYDIQPSSSAIKQQDTIMNPPEVNGKWVMTNPPYLARNKAKDKAPFEKYKASDLYKIAVLHSIGSKGGLFIIPANFFFDEQKRDIADKFLSRYRVMRLNIFTYPVFDNTSYSVCAFSFIDNGIPMEWQYMDVYIYRRNNENPIFRKLCIDRDTGWRIGGPQFRRYGKEKPLFSRVVGPANKISKGVLTHMKLVAIDRRTEPLHIEIEEPWDFIGKNTDRNATFLTVPSGHHLSLEEQCRLAQAFNKEIAGLREETGNLIFTNYRDNDRKRIGFSFVYRVLTYLYEKMYNIR